MISRGARRVGVAPDTSGGIEQVGHRLHDGRFHRVLERLDDRAGYADPGDAPRADAPPTLQVFECRNDLVDVLTPRGRKGGALIVAVRVHGVVFTDVAVQEVEIDTFETHRLQARVERLLELRRRRARARRAELTLGGDANAGRHHAPECCCDHGLAGAVHRRGVDHVDTGRQRGIDRGNRFRVAGLAPPLPEPTPAEGQPADVIERAELRIAHWSNVSRCVGNGCITTCRARSGLRAALALAPGAVRAGRAGTPICRATRRRRPVARRTSPARTSPRTAPRAASR